LLAHLATSRKLASIVHIAYIAIMAYIISVEKQCYQEPRPPSYDDRIRMLDWTCPHSYSLPSGHNWFSVLLFEPVISDLVGNEGPKKGILVWVLMLGMLIPIAGLCLGSHSLHQALMGVVHSLAALLIYKCLMQRVIYQLMVKALKGISLWPILVGNTICLFLAIAHPIFLYNDNIYGRTAFTSFGLFLLNFACGKKWTVDDL
jgi:hypothetical protein